MLHTKFQGNKSSGSGEENFKVFLCYHICAWRPSWPCDFEQIYINISLFRLRGGQELNLNKNVDRQQTSDPC